MLTLNKLTIKNFGPFRGKQVLEFPKEGILIIYGENMRGKTSLLNAIRYVFFGKVLGRGSADQSLHQLSNWEEAEQGHYGFSVILEFTSNGNEYELTRTLSPLNGIETPKSDTDYSQYCFLKKNDIMLSPADMSIELTRIMPEQVSRFFLFDGELLQEYEELLRQDSEMGDKITKAIERILGVPILINSRVDVSDLHKKAQKQASIAAQKDQKTRELGNHMESLGVQRQSHETELIRLNMIKEDLLSQKGRYDEELRSYERIKAWLDELDSLVEEEKKYLSQYNEKIELRKQYMGVAWKSIISKKTKLLIQELDYERELLQKKESVTSYYSILETAISENNCPICTQQLSLELKEKITRKISETEPIDLASIRSRLDEIIYSLKVLKSFEADDISSMINELTKDIVRLQIELASKKDRIKEIEKQASGFDQSKVRALYAENTNVIKKIGSIEEGIKAEEVTIKRLDEDIRNLEKKIREAGGGGTSLERKRSELYANLHELFERCIKEYREDLRNKVEKEATQIFTKLTSEPDYKSLKITDTYGLMIVHKDEKTIPIRSAGAEHIVALSLMGSLHRNAPLSGPIIMDSPFGRLDEEHTSKVITALPEMADQVVLLVYRSELVPLKAREALQGNLKGEYRLVRLSAKNTSIVKNIEE